MARWGLHEANGGFKGGRSGARPRPGRFRPIRAQAVSVWRAKGGVRRFVDPSVIENLYSH